MFSHCFHVARFSDGKENSKILTDHWFKYDLA